MTPLALLILIVLLVLIWQSNTQCRDIATRMARETCRRQDLQFLDGTVSLRSIIPTFKEGRLFCLKRTYVFDYSDDTINRRNGCIVMYNARIKTVLLEGLPN